MQEWLRKSYSQSEYNAPCKDKNSCNPRLLPLQGALLTKLIHPEHSRAYPGETVPHTGNIVYISAFSPLRQSDR